MKTILRFFSHPAVGIAGSIASLIGLALAVFFYYDGQRSPLFSYYVNPVRTTVVKAGDANGLQVSFSGKEVQGDISAVQIALWNAGKQPITTEQLLSPIVVSAEGGTQILEATIRKTSRPVTKVVLDQSKLSNGVLGVSWKILEQNDGCVVQLIYAGGTDKPFVVAGDIVGQRQIAEVRFPGNISSAADQYTKYNLKQRGASIVLGLLCGILIFMLFSFIPAMRLMVKNFRMSVWVKVGLLLLLSFTLSGIGFVVYVIIFLYHSRVPELPFGF